MLRKILLLSLIAISAFALNRGEININDKDLEVSAKFDIGQLNPAVEPDTTFIGLKFLKADKSHADTTYKSFDPFYEANFLIMRSIGNSGMKMGLGMKLNATKNFVSMPLGVEFSYKMPLRGYVKMYLNGELYYAPTVLTFRDGDNFLEYRLSYDIELIKNGALTLGYRSLDTNYKVAKGYGVNGGDFNYNSFWYVGFKIGF